MAQFKAQRATALLATVAALGWSEVALGQSTDSVSTSQTETAVFNPPTTTTVNTTNRSTQIIGRIGGGTPLYDRTFPVAFSDPAAQAGVIAARAAITTAGGPGVIIGAPVLTASSSTSVSTSATTYTLAGTVRTSSSPEFSFGPGSIQIGARSACAGISALPGPTRPTCGPVAPTATITQVSGTSNGQYLVTTPTTLILVSGGQNINVNTNTAYTIDQTTTTTTTTTIFEQYTLTGIVRRIGSVHALALEAAGDATDLFARTLRESGEGDLRRGFWLTGRGLFGQRAAQGEIAADRRSGEGLSGGFVADLGVGLSAGAGIDWSRTRVSLPVVGESGETELVQAGIRLGWHNGPLHLRLSGALGWGHNATLTAPNDFAFTTAARYEIRTATLSGEIGYAIPLGAWQLTPSAGAGWRRVKSDGFTEPGTYGLRAAPASSDWTKGWAGLELGRPTGQGGWLRFYGRLTVNGHDRVVLPVSFAQLGGGTMALESADYGSLGGEAGASVQLQLFPGGWLTAAYDARLRQGFALHSMTGGIKVAF